MPNIEDGSEPSPPDIRNSGPLPAHHGFTVDDKQSAHVCSPHGEQNALPSNTTNDKATTANRITRLARDLLLPVAIVAAVLTIVSATANALAARPTAPGNPHPSPYAKDGTLWGTSSGAATRHGGERGGAKTSTTPVLSLLKACGKWVLSHASASLGYDLVPRPAAGLHKREHIEMDGGHIAMACMIPVLVALSGIFAGLTLGYFSVDPTQLHVLSISGTPKQQEYARRILPVRKNSHLLLTTLILGNMIVNEALPVIMDGVLGGGIIAVVISTALVVIFAEIIPQSICSRHGLAIGATMAPVVRVLIWFFFPLGYPIAKLLEYILGRHHGIIYRRAELRELIKLHAATADGGGDLDLDTVTIAQGALDLAQKTVKDAMTPIDDVFMLPITAKLDYETLGEVVRSGHSRIPVYQLVEIPDIDLTKQVKPTTPSGTRTVKKVIGSMLVKSCVLLDPEDATPLASIPINSIPTVPWNEPLTNILNAFQEGRSHMAIVSRRSREIEGIDEEAESMSIMTNAAGGLKQRFMRKVAGISHKSSGSDSDSDVDVELGHKGRGLFRRKSVSTTSASTKSLKSPTIEPTEAEKIKTIVEEEKAKAKAKKSNAGFGLKLSQNEQLVPADAELPAKNLEQFFEGLEGAPLGIITLEDVLEELIGEEIYDEYDKEGGPPSAVSQFVPREAVLAARKAQLEREKKARLAAAAVPLPSTNDADLEHQQAGAAVIAPTPKRAKPVMPRLPTMPKFSLTRPKSQPGRAREVAPTTPTATAVPVKRPPSPPKSGPTVPPGPALELPPALQPDDLPAVAPDVAVHTEEPTVLGLPALSINTATPMASPAPVHSSLLTEVLAVERARRQAPSAPGIARTPVLTTPAMSRTGTPSLPGAKRTPMFKSAPLAPEAVPGKKDDDGKGADSAEPKPTK